jgi:CO/xanthine dehydrogenase Mo-binding subunit
LRKIGASAKEVFIQSAATKWQVDVFTCYAENGKVTQHNFYDSPVLCINEVPEVEVLVLADGGRVKGVGEPGVPPFAPALANAIFAATGKRIRKMPFDINDI